MEKCMRSKQNKLLEKYKQFFIESEKKEKFGTRFILFIYVLYRKNERQLVTLSVIV